MTGASVNYWLYLVNNRKLNFAQQFAEPRALRSVTPGNQRGQHMAEEKAARQYSVAWILLPAAAAWFYFGAPGGCTERSIHGKVTADAEAQYGIAARQGTPVDRCVHAGLVAAAYLQAKDEGSYTRWKATQAADCKAAGVPH